jgi:hypothetical protein
MRPFFICILFVVSEAAHCQPLFLYKTDDASQKYVLTRYYHEAGASSVSEVIIAETFSVHRHDAFCQVTMSNAWLFRTQLSDVSLPGATNGVEQKKAFFNVMRMDFRNGTKLIFNGSSTELSQAKLEDVGGTNMVHFQGDAAVRELKRMGLDPPDDIDETKK